MTEVIREYLGTKLYHECSVAHSHDAANDARRIDVYHAPSNKGVTLFVVESGCLKEQIAPGLDKFIEQVANLNG